MSPLVLTFNLPPDKQRKVEALAKPLGITVRAVPKGAFGCTLEVLCREEHPPVSALVQPFPDEMVLLAELTEEQSDTLLTSIARKVPIDLKCVLTPTNRSWSALTLHHQIAQEHRALSQRHLSVHMGS